jgi:hypothetical protein
MKISGHKTRNVFGRYNVASDQDLKKGVQKRNRLTLRTRMHLRNTLNGVKLFSSDGHKMNEKFKDGYKQRKRG